MKTTTKQLTVKDIIQLQAELEIMLTSKLNLGTRYKFNGLKKQVEEITDAANETKNALIEKHGTKNEEGIFHLKVYEDGSDTELSDTFKAFQTDWMKEVEQEKELSYQPITLDVIEKIETDKDIQIIFKLID